MSEYREKRIYDVSRRNCLDDEAWEYIGSTTADDIDRAITNVRYKYHCGKRPGQYLSPLNRNHEDAFGWQWKAEEAASEPSIEEMGREQKTTFEVNDPEAIVTAMRKSMENPRNFTLKDKIGAAFILMFFEDRAEDGKTKKRFTQHDISEFIGMDDKYTSDLLKNESIVSIATCILEYCKQFEKWFDAVKVGSLMKAEIKDYTDKWLSALKKGTKK